MSAARQRDVAWQRCGSGGSVSAAQLRDVGGSLAAARVMAMAMATKRVMVNTTIKFK